MESTDMSPAVEQPVRKSDSEIRSLVSASRRRILVLVGPTASGKTDVALHLARMFGGEIISADSRQVYKYLTVGTAKPTPEQRAVVKHYFVDELLPEQECNAGDFGSRGREIIDALFNRNTLPIVVGGSGLYVQSLIDGFFAGPGADKELRTALETQLKEGRYAELLDELGRVDPDSAARIDPTKPRRVIRALEIYRLTGIPLSQLHRETKPLINFVPVMFGLEWEKKALYQRIDRRCQKMISDGLLSEVEELERRGYGPAQNALNTVGYAEAFAYRRGEISFDEMVRLFKQNSRRYAKRQLTWFRRDRRIEWIPAEEGKPPSDLADTIAGKFKLILTLI